MPSIARSAKTMISLKQRNISSHKPTIPISLVAIGSAFKQPRHRSDSYAHKPSLKTCQVTKEKSPIRGGCFHNFNYRKNVLRTSKRSRKKFEH